VGPGTTLDEYGEGTILSHHPGLELLIVQPVASHCTDYSGVPKWGGIGGF